MLGHDWTKQRWGSVVSWNGLPSTCESTNLAVPGPLTFRLSTHFGRWVVIIYIQDETMLTSFLRHEKENFKPKIVARPNVVLLRLLKFFERFLLLAEKDDRKKVPGKYHGIHSLQSTVSTVFSIVPFQDFARSVPVTNFLLVPFPSLLKELCRWSCLTVPFP